MWSSNSFVSDVTAETCMDKQSKKKNDNSTTEPKDQQDNDAYGFDHYQKRISQNERQHRRRMARLYRGRSCSHLSSSESSQQFNSSTSDYGSFEGLNKLNTRNHNRLTYDAVPRITTSHSMQSGSPYFVSVFGNIGPQVCQNWLSNSLVCFRRKRDDLSNIYSIQDEYYYMKNPRRGTCLIINIKHAVGNNPRNGTENDVRKLHETFRILEFDVNVNEDLTNRGIETVINRCAQENHSNDDCFVLVIMSHGREGYIYTTDGEMSLNTISSPIKNCRTLIGKPKFICIQACRGNQIDRGLRINERHANVHGMSTDSIISPELDVVIAYSTTPDFVSWRDTSKGSIYIEVLCHYLKKEGQSKEITKLLQKVNNAITKHFNEHSVCQVPCYTSSLSKSLVFSMKKRPVTILYDDGTFGPAIGHDSYSYSQ